MQHFSLYKMGAEDKPPNKTGLAHIKQINVNQANLARGDGFIQYHGQSVEKDINSLRNDLKSLRVDLGQKKTKKENG